MLRCIDKEKYFDWLYDQVCKDNGQSSASSYRKLLSYLHDVEFTYRYKKDEDRAYDGVNLRHRFALIQDDYRRTYRSLEGDPCSVLEMMLALAIRCEDTMHDPLFGDRTGQWFWKMIVNLGLGGMTDFRYDERIVEDTIYKFLNRKYEIDGRGGLFTIRNCDRDVRRMLIWDQLCHYLDTML